MNSETHEDGFDASVDYEVMCGIIGQRIAQLAEAINDELRRPAPDAQCIELLELQQAELRRLRDEVKPEDARAIARHIAHFGPIVRGHGDGQTWRDAPMPRPH
ncbi:protein of unknown function [Paraburkholderia kururiensis]|uniref:hypothetical protein n=1 Tax=Paraburkholderia kururiensis TaxID=984307 RepID=UPI0039A4A928